MKKFQIFILILVIAGLLAFADYFVNLPSGIPIPKPSLPSSDQLSESEVAEAPEVVNHPNVTKLTLDRSGQTAYTIEKRSRSTELFESFDLSSVANLSIYKNILINKEVAAQLPIYVYEIHGPTGQGSVTYISIKLAMIDQLGSAAGINETGDLGYSSLFYNNTTIPSSGFLLSQIGDTIFGFQYNKESSQDFDFVKSLVNNYMSLIQ